MQDEYAEALDSNAAHYFVTPNATNLVVAEQVAIFEPQDGNTESITYNSSLFLQSLHVQIQECKILS